MLSRASAIVVSLIVLVLILPVQGFVLGPEDGTDKEKAESVDLLKDALAINSANFPKPPTEFNNGHVTSKQIADYLDRKENGFTIQLPSGSAAPSPTIHNGKIYVSGGFGSKEFYCFDAKTGELVWAKDLDDDGPSSAVVEDGVVVFNTESCTIFACDAETGDHLWSYWLGDPLMSTPTIANGKVYTAYPASPAYGSYGQDEIDTGNREQLEPSRLRPTHALACFDLKTGEILWQKWIDGDVMTAPIAIKDELYVVTFPGTFYKFQQDDGKILAASAARATSAPILVNNKVYTSRRADDGEKIKESIASYDPKDFKMEHEYAEKEAPYLDPSVQDKSKLKKDASSLDAGNGFAGGAPASSGWAQASANIGQSNVSSLQAFQGSRVLHFKGINFNLMGDELISSDPDDGKVMWKKKVSGDLASEGGFLGTAPILVGDRVLLATLSGEIVVYDTFSGELKHKFETGQSIRSQPVVQDGWIYVASQNGSIICIDSADKTLTGWPMLGCNAAHTNSPN